MKTAVPVLVCMLASTIWLPSASADSLYSSVENWRFYLDSCRQLDEAMGTVRKQIDNKANVVFSNGIQGNIESMDDAIKYVKDKDKISRKYIECQQKSKRAQGLFAEAEAYDKLLQEQQSQEARRSHEDSPIFKKALELGFDDYGWLAALESDFREVGQERLKKWMILVDSDCGRHYEATQYVKPYVIYKAYRSYYNLCSSRETPIAVLPSEGVTVNRGDYIDKNSYYVFAGVLEGKGTDGFPIEIPLLKQVKVED